MLPLPLLLLLGTGAAAAAPGPTYHPGSCPPQSDFAGRRTVVLGWARQLLNNSIDAGGSYGARAFLRDTNTFIDVALDYTDPSLMHPFVLGLFAGQHTNGDVGTCCVDFNATTRKPLPACPLDTAPYSNDPAKSCNVGGFQTPFTKADVTTDAEASLVSTVFKYVRDTGHSAILEELVVSQQDHVSRTVRERLGMLLNYLGNSTGRFHDGYGLIWGGTCADWGDEQQGMHATKLPYPGGYGPTNMDPLFSTATITPYSNAMYVFLEPFLCRNDCFTKTGSGQT
jgi:hypothetical protein